MENLLEIKNVCFSYKNRETRNLSHINMCIKQGEFVLLTGPTGCGKSTLLKALNGLIPHESGGEFTGDVWVNGKNTKDYSIAQLSSTVGMVFQSPDDQIFSTTVFDETAFVLENMGLPSEEIKKRVQETLALVGLAHKENASIHALSGGQKQRLAVASVLVARPPILALDEPISQLDPQGAAELLALLKHVNQTLGMTILIVEHRIHEVMPLCHRVIIMNEGRQVWQGTQQEACSSPEVFDAYGIRMPQSITVCQQLGISITSSAVEEAALAIGKRYALFQVENSFHEKAKMEKNVPVIDIKELSFRYEQHSSFVLKNIRITIGKGQFVALMGSNGAGKSTLLQHIGGLLSPQIGQVQILGTSTGKLRQEVGIVLQNPDFMLFNETVVNEIAFALMQQAGRKPWSPYCQMLLEKLGLGGLENEFPLSLSRGQRLRVAIGAVLSCEPSILLLDEPTTGQDISHIEDIVTLLKNYTAQGGTVIFCTHDGEVAARYADRILVMDQGEIIGDGHPRDVFMQNKMLLRGGLKKPACLQLAQELYGGVALTVEEVVNHVRQKSLGSHAM